VPAKHRVIGLIIGVLAGPERKQRKTTVKQEIEQPFCGLLTLAIVFTLFFW